MSMEPCRLFLLPLRMLGWAVYFKSKLSLQSSIGRLVWRSLIRKGRRAKGREEKNKRGKKTKWGWVLQEFLVVHLIIVDTIGTGFDGLQDNMEAYKRG